MSEEVADVETDASQAADVEVVDSATEATASEGASGEGIQSGASSFAWDEWDGTVDALPEEHRELGGRFHSHYDTRLTEKSTEYDGLRELYDAMMSGQEDPRVARLQGENKSYGERHKALEDQFNTYKAQVEESESYSSARCSHYGWCNGG